MATTGMTSLRNTGTVMVSGLMDDDGADRGQRQRARRPAWNSAGAMRRIATVLASAAVKNYGGFADAPDGDGHGPGVSSPRGVPGFAPRIRAIGALDFSGKRITIFRGKLDVDLWTVCAGSTILSSVPA